MCKNNTRVFQSYYQKRPTDVGCHVANNPQTTFEKKVRTWFEARTPYCIWNDNWIAVWHTTMVSFDLNPQKTKEFWNKKFYYKGISTIAL